MSYNTQLVSENFESGTATGWTNNTVSKNVGQLGSFLGRFGGTAGQEGVSKVYSFGKEHAGQTVQIEFDFYEIDSWDGEQFKVFVNGAQVSSKQYWTDGYYGNKDGGVAKGNSFNTSWSEEAHHYTIEALVDANGQVKIGFGSTLDQDAGDESWGIDNLTIKAGIDWHNAEPEATESAANLVKYLDALLAEVSQTQLYDKDSYDLMVMQQQIKDLSAHYAQSPTDFNLTLGEVQAQLFTLFQQDMQSQTQSVFGFDSKAYKAYQKDNKLESWKHETAGMVEKFDKSLNNAFYLGDMLKTNWDKFRSGDWTLKGDELTQGAAPGKKQVDVFRKEMIYALQTIENVRKLGQTLSSRKLWDSDKAEHGAEIAQFALDSLKTIGRATQLGIVGYQQKLASDSYSRIKDGLALNNVELNTLLSDFQRNVSTDPSLDSLQRTPVNGANPADVKEFDYKDYAGQLEKLNAKLAEKLEAFEAQKTTLSDDIDHMNLTSALKEAEIQRLQNELNAESRPGQQEALRAQLEELNGELESVRDGIENKRTELTEVEANIRDFGDTKTRINDDNLSFKSSEKTAAGTELGYRLVSIGSTIAGLVGKSQSGKQNAVSISSGTMSLTADLADAVGAIAKLANSAKNLQAGLGAVSGIVGAGPAVAGFAQSIMNIANAPEGYEGYYIGEAVVQGANMVMGLAIGAMTTYAALAGTTVSSAVPVLGAIAAVASAINPMQWAAFTQQQNHINDVKEKTDINNEAYETSAAMLAELLVEFRNIDIGYYSASSATSVVGGVGASVAVATGVGAPVALLIAGITAGLTALLGLFKQVHLNAAADSMANKLRNWDGGVAGFFDRSFEYQSDKELKKFFEEAQKLIDSGFDSVSALGSVQMTASDLELTGLSGVGGELKQTQKHFSGYLEESDLATKNWHRETIKIDPTGGTVTLGDANAAATGKNNFLQFITPFDAAGSEHYRREETGKNTYKTTLTISDLKGWTLNDGGNNTTFDLRNVVTKARDSYGAPLKDIVAVVNAGAGDDMFLMTDVTGRTERNGSLVNINGGSGQDSATYANLQYLVDGLKVNVSAQGNILVEKKIGADTKIMQGAIGQYTVQRGKESETVQYRYIESSKLGSTITLFDELKDVEMLAGSQRNDVFDVAAYNKAFLAAGLDGNDTFMLKQGQAALGGNGDDTFIAKGDVKTTGKTEADLPEQLEIAGGDGHDTLKFEGAWASKSFELGALYQISEQVLDSNVELRNALMPSAIASEVGEDVAVATVANMISENGWAMTSFLTLDSIEEVVWDLNTVHKIVFGSGSSLSDTVYLAEYESAARAFLNRSTVGDYEGLVTFAAPLTQKTSDDDAVSGLNIIGTDNADGILGTQYDDILLGGDGNDRLDAGAGFNVLTGGEGADLFQFSLLNGSTNLVTLVDYSLESGKTDFADQAFKDKFEFNLNSAKLSDINFNKVGSDLNISYASGTNLITNGSFEDVRHGYNWNGSTPYGWSRSGNGGVFQAPNDRKSDGSFAYALGGWSSAADGVLTQTTSVQVGKSYQLNFDLGSAYNTYGDRAGLEVSIFNAISGERMSTFNTSTAGRVGLSEHKFSFVASSDQIKIQFKQLGGYRGDLDLDIDDIQLRQQSVVTMEHFFTAAYSAQAQQTFTFKTREGDKTMGYQTLSSMASVSLSAPVLSNMGERFGVASSEFKGDLTNIVVGDFNGDGKDDFIRQEKGSWDDDSFNTANVFLATGSGNFSKVGDLGVKSGVSTEEFKGDLTNIIVGDFNGDGKDDFIRQEKGGWDDDSFNTANVYLATGSGGFSKVGELGALAGVHNEEFKGDLTNIIVGDFNGDGKDDFIRQEKGAWDDDSFSTANVYLATGSGSFSKIGELGAKSGANTEWFKGDFTNIVVGDFNGDGKDDFIRQEKGAWDDDSFDTANVFLATGSGNFSHAGELVSWAGAAGDPFKGDYSTLIVDDFNGDRLDDLLVQTADNEPDLYLSNGASFKLVDDLSIASHRDNTRLYAGDWDGNGYSDLIRQELWNWNNTANTFLFG